MKKYINQFVGALSLIFLCMYLNTVLDLSLGIVDAVAGFTTQSIVVSCALLIMGVCGLVAGSCNKLWQNIVGLIAAIVYVVGFIVAGIMYSGEVVTVATLASVPLFIFGLIFIVSGICKFIVYFVNKKKSGKKETKKVTKTINKKKEPVQPVVEEVKPAPKKITPPKFNTAKTVKNPFDKKGGRK